MRRLTLVFLLVLLMVTAGCRPKTTRYQAEFLGLFDTVTTIIGYAESKEPPCPAGSAGHPPAL